MPASTRPTSRRRGSTASGSRRRRSIHSCRSPSRRSARTRCGSARRSRSPSRVARWSRPWMRGRYSARAADASTSGSARRGAHPFSPASYLREVGLPAMTRGLARAGRTRADITVACPVFSLVDASPTLPAEEAYVRQQIAFYGSTPTYRVVLAHHGWSEVGEQLSDLVRAGRLAELPRLVTDAMLDAFVTRAATYEELGRQLQERYRGILNRIGLYGDISRIARSDVDALRRGLEPAHEVPTGGPNS